MSIHPFVPARLRRSIVFFLVVASTSLALFLIIFPSPDLSQELELLQRVADLELRVRTAERVNARRKQQLVDLFTQFSQVVANLQDDCGDRSVAGELSKSGGSVGSEYGPEAWAMVRAENWTYDLAIPGVHDFLPHTVASPSSFAPAFKMAPSSSSGRRRQGVSVVMGVPTVKRDHQSYLSVTLKSLLENMTEEEAADCLVVVMVAEADVEYARGVAEEIQTQFPTAVESGLVEVICPPASYYPQWSSLRRTLGDDMGRVQWRSKQNLDYAFLMMYAANERGTFYVQLEDDILTKPGYVSTMREFALLQEAKDQGLVGKSYRNDPKPPWFLIDYCQLGFIGKLFRSTDLPRLVQFFLMFYNDKPVDWLLENALQTMVCKLDHDDKRCKKEKSRMWIHYKPSLFQHIGTHSSLKGKVQKLKDKQFGRVSMFKPHADNPPAKVTSRIKHYKGHSLGRAYAGETFYWGLAPQAGDVVDIELNPPVTLERFRFVSGNAEHPSDRFPEGTPVSVKLMKGGAFGRTPSFTKVGAFDANGVAEGVLGGAEWGPVAAMRMKVPTAGENWVILSEIYIKAGPGDADSQNRA